MQNRKFLGGQIHYFESIRLDGITIGITVDPVIDGPFFCEFKMLSAIESLTVVVIFLSLPKFGRLNDFGRSVIYIKFWHMLRLILPQSYLPILYS